MTDFQLVFVGAFVLNATLTFRGSALWKRSWCKKSVGIETTTKPVNDKEAKWRSLISRYLCVYLLATTADWLQGAYVYVLYHAYSYTQYDIALLFIVGFGSSAICGTAIGSLADRYGRRTFVVVYGLVYAASCVTKHFRSFYILLLGRLLGGIATSLLFSIFEAWLIRAHNDSKLNKYISKSFTWAAYGNSIIAIASGLIANHATETSTMHSVQDSIFYVGGYLEPFDMAFVVSIVCGFAALHFWEENYGGGSDEIESSDIHRDETNRFQGGLRTAIMVTIRSRQILLCGIVSSLYEGSMYIFIFMWTPALMQDSNENELPFGLIFSTFMVSSMAGSSFFGIANGYFRLEFQALIVFILAALSMVWLLFVNEQTSQYMAMNLFEFSIGMYFPVIGCLKSAIVPESQRASIYNLYRIPLNLIVLLGLLKDMSPQEAFVMNLVMLVAAALLQILLIQCRKKNLNVKALKKKITEPLTEESDVDLESSSHLYEN